jgi:hypothetical protein
VKAITLALCLAATGCADTLPQDTLARFANTIESLKYAYHALCDDREEAAECEHIRGVVNTAVDKYTALNAAISGEDKQP